MEQKVCKGCLELKPAEQMKEYQSTVSNIKEVLCLPCRKDAFLSDEYSKMKNEEYRLEDLMYEQGEMIERAEEEVKRLKEMSKLTYEQFLYHKKAMEEFQEDWEKAEWR